MTVKTSAKIGDQDTTTTKSHVGFYGLLLYVVTYYAQLGERYSVLAKIRFELLVGSFVILLSIIKISKQKYNLTKIEKSILYACYAFIAACLISIPTTIAGQYSIDALVKFFKAISILIMIYAFVTTEKELKIFVYVFLFMTAFIFVESFINSLSGKLLHADGGGLIRLYGTTGLFAHPNALGLLTAGMCPLIFYLILYEKSLMKKLILVAIGVIGLIVIQKSQSRSAMVGVLSSGLFLWVQSKKKILSLVVMIVFFGVAWSLVDKTTKERYLTVLDSKSIVAGENIQNQSGEEVRRGSMEKRYQIIIDGFILFQQRPITGYGIGGYQVARIEKLGRWQVAHNAYSQCLAELGIVGFIPFVMIIVYTYSALNKAKHSIQINEKIDECEFIYKMTFAFQGYLFVHLCLSMFGHTPYQNYWWIPAAISLVILRILRKTGMEIKSH